MSSGNSVLYQIDSGSAMNARSSAARHKQIEVSNQVFNAFARWHFQNNTVDTVYAEILYTLSIFISNFPLETTKEFVGGF